MLIGFEGHLLSDHVLEEASAEARSKGDVHRFVQTALRDWQRRQHGLGPASSLRAILEVGAEPLVRVLGFGDGAAEIRPAKNILVATLRTGASTPVILVVTAWGDRLDPLWRTAIVEASRCQAGWCLLFNGTHLRLQIGRAHV